MEDTTGDTARVAVIMGGQSAERDVSLRTGATVVRELEGLYLLKPVEILADGRWRVARSFVGEGLAGDPARWFAGEGLPVVEALGQVLSAGVDAVFNALHGPMGEDGTVQGLFRVLGLPFTGPDVIPAAVAMDKRLTKQVLLSAGIPTPRFFTIPAAALRGIRVGTPEGTGDGAVDWAAVLDAQAGRVPLPWVLKPNRLGSSVGVAILRDAAQVLQEAQDVVGGWPSAGSEDDLLVEEAVRGRELTCGVLETDGPPRALLPIEIRPRSSAFFDYHAKYTPGASEEICPAPLTPPETALVQRTAVAVHSIIGCAPLSRTDMFLTPSGGIQVLEVNTLPGMTGTSLIPLAASKEGIPLRDLLASLVEHGLARAAKEIARSYNR